LDSNQLATFLTNLEEENVKTNEIKSCCETSQTVC